MILVAATVAVGVRGIVVVGILHHGSHCLKPFAAMAEGILIIIKDFS